MKKLLLIFYVLACLIAGNAYAAQKTLVPTQDAKTGLWGLQEEGTTKWKVKPKYEAMTPMVIGGAGCYAKRGDAWVYIYKDGKEGATFKSVLPYSDEDNYIIIEKSDGVYGYNGKGAWFGSSGFYFTEPLKLTSDMTIVKDINGKYRVLALINGNIGSGVIEEPYNDPYSVDVKLPYAKVCGQQLEFKKTDDPEHPYKYLDPNYMNQDPETHIRIVKGDTSIKLVNELTNQTIAEVSGIFKMEGQVISEKSWNSGPYGWRYSFINEIPDLTAILIYTKARNPRDENYFLVYNNKTGEVIIPQSIPNLDYYQEIVGGSGIIRCLAPDCFWIVSNETAALYNTKGEKLFEGEIGYVGTNSTKMLSSYGDHMEVVLKDGTKGVMNNQGKWMIGPIKCLGISAIVEKDKSEISGYKVTYDSGYKVEYSLDFKPDSEPSNLHYVSRGNQFAYADADDKVVTNWYDREDAVTAAALGGSGQSNYGGGIKLVSRGGKYGLLDTFTGKEVVPCMYDQIGGKAYGMIRVKKNGLCGFLNSDFKLVVPCKYLSVGNFREVFGVAQNPFAEVVISTVGAGSYKTGYINKKGVLFETMTTAKRNVSLW